MSVSPGEQIKILRTALEKCPCIRREGRRQPCRFHPEDPPCARCSALAATVEHDDWVFAYRVEIGGQILMPDDTTWVTVEWIRDQGGGQRQIAHVEGGLSNVEAGALLRYRPPVEDDHARR